MDGSILPHIIAGMPMRHALFFRRAVVVAATLLASRPIAATAQQRPAAPAASPGAEALRLERREDPRVAPARHEGDGPFTKLIIRGATLIDGTGGPPRGPVDIVIEGNRITDIVNVGVPHVAIDSTKRPKGAAREIDGSGMYVLPGIVDLHV